MIIYIYVKTHKKTGLKYLGKTSSSNPHKYLGSGVYWRAHLEKHGNEHDTDILQECYSKEDVKHWGTYYSVLWNVVEAKDAQGNKIWANLKPETGDGGASGHIWTPEERKALSEKLKGRISPNKGKTYEELYGKEKAIEKIERFKKSFNQTVSSKPKKEKSKKLPYSSDRVGVSYEELYGLEKANEIRAKQKGKLAGEKNPRYGKPGTFKNKQHTEESLAKMRQPTGPHKKKRELLTCPHCKKASDASNAKRWHFGNCKSKT
jgi:hypothetical protein